MAHVVARHHELTVQRRHAGAGISNIGADRAAHTATAALHVTLGPMLHGQIDLKADRRRDRACYLAVLPLLCVDLGGRFDGDRRTYCLLQLGLGQLGA